MPRKNVPAPASSSRPVRGVPQARDGSAISAPATQYSKTAPGAPVSQESPGAKIPPKDSPHAHTTSPQARLASPAARDHRPRGAASSHIPIPAWIQTEAAAAVTGWSDQMVPPALTRSWTQRGEACAAGSMTWDGRPPGIFGWACKRPSSSHKRPKPIRSTCRARGSAAGAGPAAAGTQFREVPQASSSSTKTAAAISPWCSSADRNAATRVGSSGLSPEFMPGTARAPSQSRPTSAPAGRESSRLPRGAGR